MLSKKDEQMSFSNGPLRDQWEKKAQLIEDECKQEAEWKKKSSLKISNSKWNYHWTLVFDGDFKKLTSSVDEEEKSKPKIKFKIVPPPPKPKDEPSPPPPPPRKTAFPKRLTEKRKVEVDVFGLCWRDSWMSLKPPKYLYLKDKETKLRTPVFTTIEVSNNRKCKPKGYGSETEWVLSADEWNHSWKQVRRPAQLECSEEKPFQWETLFKRKLVCKAEIELYSLPVWAGTWKIMTFAFRQRKKNWDCTWPVYQLSLSKFDRMQLEEQEEPSDWEDSWKLSGAEHKPKDTTDDETPTARSSNTETMAKMKIIEVFLPGWNNSWLLSAAPLEEEEQLHKDWSSCWGYRQQIRWCKASMESHFQHSAMLTRRRKATNLLLTSHLDDKVTDDKEWMEAWRTPKRWVKPEDDELDKEIHEEDKVMFKKEESEKEDEDNKEDSDNKVEESEEEDEEGEGEEEDEEEEEGEEEKDKEEDKGKQQEEKHAREKNRQEEKDQNTNQICGEDEDEEEDSGSHDEDTDAEEKDKMSEIYEDEEGEEEEEDIEEEEEEEDTDKDADGAEVMVENDEEDHEEEDEKEEDNNGDQVKKQIKPDVPLHLQFHKLYTSFPSWKKSWTVAVAYRGGDEGQGEEEEEGEEEDDEWWAWKESWRICKRNKPDKDEVVCFSTEHRSQRFVGLMHGEDRMPTSEWTLSWKMTKTAKKEKVEMF